ncbi:MAG: glutamate-cysteine ligase family protein [Deferrisomatales bacterium]
MTRTVGLEMEMAVARRGTGEPGRARAYFAALCEAKRAGGEPAVLDQMAGRPFAVRTPKVVSGIDNGFNNLESALGPYGPQEGGLSALWAELTREKERVLASLLADGATVLNLSQHPLTEITDEFYLATRAPKPIYEYWTRHRGWRHSVGIDAKAQNGPTTGVDAHEAVDALNVVLGTGPAFVALYANSPFENGRVTENRENRLTIWPRMFQTSRFSCDRRLQGMPSRPFRDLRHYFQWMFGPGTAMQFVLNDRRNYKRSERMIVVDGDPSLLDYLRGRSWSARDFFSGEALRLTPASAHLAQNQFASFADARIRYAFDGAELPVEELLAALDGVGDEVERLFAARTRYLYIEGRIPGANFADAELLDLADGDVARSVEVSASALQKGLLCNLEAAKALVARYPWEGLASLRGEAVRHGLGARCGDLDAVAFCREVLAAAEGGLAAEERWMLAYPRHVLATGQNGADRALASYGRRHGGTAAERIRAVAVEREAVTAAPARSRAA